MAASLVVVNATPDRVHLVLSNPDGYSIGKIMRVDVNGTRTVRTLVGQLPSTDASVDLYDYEYAPYPGKAVVYTAYSTTNASLATVSWGPFAASDAVLVLACPLYPSNGLVLFPDDAQARAGGSFGLSWQSTRTAQSTLHRVVGRSDPVVVLRPAATRAGDLTLICPDHATCELIEAQLSLPQVWMLRQSDVAGLDAYFVVTSLSASNVPDVERWQLVIGLQEIAWPPGSFVPPSAWTYNDVLAQYGDYNAVAASFATYADLTDKNPIP